MAGNSFDLFVLNMFTDSPSGGVKRSPSLGVESKESDRFTD
jgi:hypothetical protein